MKELKDKQLKFRLTTADENKIKEYCEKHNMTISEFMRMACDKILMKENQQ